MAELALNLAQARDYVEDNYGICLPMSHMYRVCEGDSPPAHFKVGRRIYLYPSSIDEWMNRQIEATSRG